MSRRLVDERRMPRWLAIASRLVMIVMAASLLLAGCVLLLLVLVLALAWIDGGAW